jgi:hypothetical protein
LLAYNARFDTKIIENTSLVEGLEPLTLANKPICIMQLWSDFLGVSKWQKLEGGDHTALGDCFATLERIKEMAAAELTDEPAPITATTEFNLDYICRRRAEIAELIKTLKAEDEVLKSYIATELERNGSDALALADGTKATWGSNVVKLKPLVALSDLPPVFVSSALDKKKVEAAILKGLPPESPMFKLFSWEMSKFPKITKA